MKLPYDYARCNAKKCAQKEECLRFTSPGRLIGYQVYSDFEAFLIPDKKCDFFIGEKNASEKKRPRNK